MIGDNFSIRPCILPQTESSSITKSVSEPGYVSNDSTLTHIIIQILLHRIFGFTLTPRMTEKAALLQKLFLDKNDVLRMA